MKKEIEPIKGVSSQNRRGEWVPAIEEPYWTGPFLLRAECRCGRRFWTKESYRAHYSLKHILAL